MTATCFIAMPALVDAFVKAFVEGEPS